MDQKKVGDFLRDLRKEKGMTQEKLAEALSVSGRSVSRWETGSSMPDISLLVQIADFYGVDVKEILEGERKSEKMKEDTREIAVKMADYADAEKNRFFRFIRILSIMGTFVMTMAIVLQCIDYKPGIPAFLAVLASFAAFVAFLILTLYVNGIMQRLVKNQWFTIAVKIGVTGLFVLCTRYVIIMGVTVGLVLLEDKQPADYVTGLTYYDKAELIEKYAAEMESQFALFPDEITSDADGEYVHNVKQGLFDSDGYVYLRLHYAPEEYEAEKERLSKTSYEIIHNGATITTSVIYDDASYLYPAYVANDGFDDAYEYVLLDDENQTMIYMVISYPENLKLDEYEKYLKRNKEDYQIPREEILEQFSIYEMK